MDFLSGNGQRDMTGSNPTLVLESSGPAEPSPHLSGESCLPFIFVLHKDSKAPCVMLEAEAVNDAHIS